MIKLAVPTSGNVVDDHFGHCDAYTVFTVNANKKIEQTEMLPSPQGCGCKSNIASYIRRKRRKCNACRKYGSRGIKCAEKSWHRSLSWLFRRCSPTCRKLFKR